MAPHKIIILTACVVFTLQFVNVAASSQSSESSSSWGSSSSSGIVHAMHGPPRQTNVKCEFVVEDMQCKAQLSLGREFYLSRGLDVDILGGEVDVVSRVAKLSVQRKRTLVVEELICDEKVPINCVLKTKHAEVETREDDRFMACWMILGEDTTVSTTIVDGKPLSTRSAIQKKCELSTLSTGEGQVTFSVDQQLSIEGAIGSVDREAIKLFVPTTGTETHYQFHCSDYESISSKFDLKSQFPEVTGEITKASGVRYSMKVGMAPPYENRSNSMTCGLVSKDRRCYAQLVTKDREEKKSFVGSHGVITPSTILSRTKDGNIVRGYVNPHKNMIGMFLDPNTNNAILCDNHPEFLQKCDLQKKLYAKVEIEKLIGQTTYLIDIGLPRGQTANSVTPTTSRSRGSSGDRSLSRGSSGDRSLSRGSSGDRSPLRSSSGYRSPSRGQTANSVAPATATVHSSVIVGKLFIKYPCELSVLSVRKLDRHCTAEFKFLNALHEADFIGYNDERGRITLAPKTGTAVSDVFVCNNSDLMAQLCTFQIQSPLKVTKYRWTQKEFGMAYRMEVGVAIPGRYRDIQCTLAMSENRCFAKMEFYLAEKNYTYNSYDLSDKAIKETCGAKKLHKQEQISLRGHMWHNHIAVYPGNFRPFKCRNMVEFVEDVDRNCHYEQSFNAEVEKVMQAEEGFVYKIDVGRQKTSLTSLCRFSPDEVVKSAVKAACPPPPATGRAPATAKAKRHHGVLSPPGLIKRPRIA